LAVDRLWQASQQGKLAKVSRPQFDAYYANQESGIGVWVDAAELLPSPIALCRLRQNWGHRWQPPQQIQQLTDDRMALIKCPQTKRDATILWTTIDISNNC
jgi:predicted transcriptional regulator